ncbi:myosin heavy chain 95F-like [Cotesia typhae]|uniref:myosin heavy chain 95F-like n=1 Tax=Cotesia typhae TaxID=2053667 RepID=UPI003D68DA3B
MNYDQEVWVPDPKEGFKLEKKNVVTTDKQYPVGNREKDEDDNCALMFLNEATLLNNIKIRYFKDKIYTYVAHILIAVNPYYHIENLYSEKTIKTYIGKSLGEEPPHIFAIADKSFRDMEMDQQSQSIIVSGESGAGKTESTKYLLNYLCKLKGSSDDSLERKILDANPVLEAFGNAKTKRNNNSSRFGKFIKVYFDKEPRIVGGSVADYLLEKSRICLQNSDERNYHIFYMLCAGAPAELRSELGITKPDDFLYLKNGCTQYFCDKKTEKRLSEAQKSRSHLEKGGLSDRILNDFVGFSTVKQAFTRLGFTEAEQNEIYSTVAAVLHLGNIAFKETSDGCEILDSSKKSVTMSAKFLGVNREELEETITINKKQSYIEVIKSPLRPDQAENARNALAKAVYIKLFDYIVSCINKSIPFESYSYYIGVLDIAGFESFEVNSFEQFCINFCNEKLQYFFNKRILKSEQELYKREKLEVPEIDYNDNKDCIKMIGDSEKGIFSILENALRLSNPKPEDFTKEVYKTWAKHPNFKEPALTRESSCELRKDEGFLIKHFAGDVCYHTNQFIEKNNDALHSSLIELMQNSSKEFLRIRFMKDPESKTKKRAAPSVSSNFKKQLRELLDELETNGANFVRCIKPNNEMTSHRFDGSCVLNQLKYSGTISVLKLMEHGYPSRVSFQDLYNMYKSYLSPELAKLEEKVFCESLLRSLKLKDEDFKFGTKRVFFKPGKFAEFDKIMMSSETEMKELVANVEKWLRESRIVKIEELKKQLLEMMGIANQLKTTGKKRIEYIKNFESKINAALENIKQDKNMQPVTIDNIYTGLKTDVDDAIIKLEKELEQQREEERRLAELEAEKEKIRQEELARIKLEEERNRKAKMATEIPDASTWKYSQLYAGFYSDNSQIKEASIIEIRKRLQVYRKWKAENDTE